jgi:hypothetical protein
MVGDEILTVVAEDLDDRWSTGKAGLSRFVHSDPIGKPLMCVQDATNKLANLTMDTIEHSIPSTFVNDEVLNLQDYEDIRARPGDLTPVTMDPAQNLSNAFHTPERSTMSKDVSMFSQYLERMSQFLVGSFPSIYGGDAKSRTAAEYSQSRQMALQRLSITWTYYNFFWADMLYKASRQFVKEMKEDEKFTTKEDGTFVTQWIRRGELRGKIGNIEPEGADSFPVSIPQKKAFLLEILNLNNEALNEAVFMPGNRGLVANILGFPEFKLPGYDQRLKQLNEIQSLKTGALVEPIPFVDDHQLHIEVCREWCTSVEGVTSQKTAPDIYQAVVNHLMMHKQAEVQESIEMMQQQAMIAGGMPPEQGGQPPQEQQQEGAPQ